MNVLQSKLQPPKRLDVLHRKRLHRIFEKFTHKKLITVLAGAGFGKTTLVLDALSHLDLVQVWYRLDKQDMDFHVFLSYLYSMIGTGEMPDNGLPESINPSNPGLKAPTDELLDWLAFLQTRVTHPTAIVLDDYHLVQDNCRINQAVEFILQRLPGHIHLIVIGRKKLPMALSRLRAQDQMMEIDEKDLAFSIHEIKQFFDRNTAVSPTDIDAIHDITNGWAAILVLLRYTFRKQAHKSIPESLDDFRKKPDYIFSYLKETVFNTQPDHVRHFMMKAALLPEIDAALCERIFGIHDARQILNRMIEDHLLLFPVDDFGDIFYLHHLFRDFLLMELKKNYSHDQICNLHCHIGKVLEPHDIFQALHHLVEGRDFNTAMQLMETHEMTFLIAGKIGFVGRQIEKFPAQILNKNPQLLLSLSRLHSHHGNPEKAIQLISEALKLFKRQGAKDKMIVCVVELASQYYFTGHLLEARLLMEQVLDEISPQSETYVIAMTFLIFFCSVLGDFSASNVYDRTAREAVSAYPDPEREVATALFDTSLSHTLYFAGKFEASQRLCQELLKKVLEMNIDPCVPLVYYQLSANSYYLGEYDAGCDYAKKGIAACEKITLADSRKGWVYLAWAQNCLGLGNHDDALTRIGECTPLFEQPGNRWGLSATWDCLAAVYLAEKKTTLAKKVIDRGLAVLNGYGLNVTRSILENTRAKALLDEGDFRAGLEMLLSSRPNLEGAEYHLFNNCLLSARAQHALGNPEDACRQMTLAVDLSMKQSYDAFLRQEKVWLIPLLDTASGLFHSAEPGVRSYLEMVFGSDLSQVPGLLDIRLLGRFRLSIGGRELPQSEWRSSKALMLLKYLAANHNKGYIHREQLMEILWPDQDPRKTAARFNMAMSSLRKTLEPGLSPKAPSAYIDRKKDSYRLFGDNRVDIDTKTFSKQISRASAGRDQGENALPCYLDAIKVYGGDFLSEDRYEEWCTDMRASLSRDYESALQAVIRMYDLEGNTEKAIFFSEKLFKEDPLNEPVVEKLIDHYLRNDLISKAKQTYSRYVTEARRLDLPVNEKVSAGHPGLVKI